MVNHNVLIVDAPSPWYMISSSYQNMEIYNSWILRLSTVKVASAAIPHNWCIFHAGRLQVALSTSTPMPAMVVAGRSLSFLLKLFPLPKTTPMPGPTISAHKPLLSIPLQWSPGRRRPATSTWKWIWTAESQYSPPGSLGRCTMKTFINSKQVPNCLRQPK